MVIAGSRGVLAGAKCGRSSGAHRGHSTAAATAAYVAQVCAGIHHHRFEDDVMWPVLRRSAGHAVDLDGLSEDHGRLDPLLDEITETAALPPRDRAAARRLAASLAALADLLDEHIEEEERTIFPITDAYVSVADGSRLEARVRRSADLRFEPPRIERYARPEEMAEPRAAAGPVLSLPLAVLRRGFARRHRLVFGGLSDA